AERDAVAAFEVAEEKRERGQRIIDTAEPAMGAAIEAILATGASTQRVQVLLDLSEGEVRKLRKRAAATGSAPASPVPVRARGAGSAPGAAAGSGAGAPGSSAGAEQPRDDQDEAGKPSP
ncbi:MAG: hypothetical protein ACRDQ5_19765, partial [Sciscionella sp.]